MKGMKGMGLIVSIATERTIVKEQYYKKIGKAAYN